MQNHVSLDFTKETIGSNTLEPIVCKSLCTLYITMTAITPRRCPPTLKTKNLSMDYHMPPGQCTADSDEDVTGDSGMGTGSGSAQYEDVETWRQALDNPPPGKTAIIM